jgi:hypothetical protein
MDRNYDARTNTIVARRRSMWMYLIYGYSNGSLKSVAECDPEDVGDTVVDYCSRYDYVECNRTWMVAQ